jgi:hypothetical protein
MRLFVAPLVGCLLGLLASGAQAATPSVLKVALPPVGDATVVVFSSVGRSPSLVLPSPGALGPDIVAAVAHGRTQRGWISVMALGRTPSAEPAPSRTIVLAWRGGGRAAAQARVGATARLARFCTVEAVLLATARRAAWRASTLAAVPAARFAGTAVRAACATGGAGAHAALRALLDRPAAAAGAPEGSTAAPPTAGSPAPGAPAASSPLPPPLSPPQPPSPPSAPVLELALSYRHAPSGSFVCVDYATTAGARVELRLTGPGQLTSVTTIPVARATGTVAVEVFEAGAYALAGSAASGGLAAQAAGTIDVLPAPGAGGCGP